MMIFCRIGDDLLLFAANELDFTDITNADGGMLAYSSEVDPSVVSEVQK